MIGKIVVYKTGDFKFIKNGITWEWETDDDYLCTIDLNNLL